MLNILDYSCICRTQPVSKSLSLRPNNIVFATLLPILGTSRNTGNVTKQFVIHSVNVRLGLNKHSQITWHRLHTQLAYCQCDSKLPQVLRALRSFCNGNKNCLRENYFYEIRCFTGVKAYLAQVTKCSRSGVRVQYGLGGCSAHVRRQLTVVSGYCKHLYICDSAMHVP